MQSSHFHVFEFREHYENFLNFCQNFNKVLGYRDYDLDYSILSDFKPSDLEQMMNLGVKYSGLGSYYEPVEIVKESFVQDYATRDLCCSLTEYSTSHAISTSWATATIAAAEAALHAAGREDLLSVSFLLKCLPELYEIRPNDVSSNDIIQFVKEYGLMSLSMAIHLKEEELCTSSVFTYKFDFSRPEVPNKSGLMNLVAEGDPVVVLMALDLLRLSAVTNVDGDQIFTGATNQPSVYGVLYGYDPKKWMVSINVVPCENIHINLPVKESETNANYAGIAAYAFSIKAQPQTTDLVVDDSFVSLSAIPSWVTKLTFIDDSFNSTGEVVIANLTNLRIIVFGNNSFANTLFLIVDAPALEEIVFCDGCFSGIGGVYFDGPAGTLEINCPLLKRNTFKKGSLLNFEKMVVNHLNKEFQLTLEDDAADSLSMIERSTDVDYSVVRNIVALFEDKKGFKGYLGIGVFDVGLIDYSYMSSVFNIQTVCMSKSTNYTCLMDFLYPDYTALPATLFPSSLPGEDLDKTEVPATHVPSGTDSPLPYPSEAPSITDSPLPYPSESPSTTDSPLPYPSEVPTDATTTQTPAETPSESPSITDSPLPYPSEVPSVTDLPLPYPSESPSITDSPLPYPSESPSITDSPLPYPSESPSITDSPLLYPSEVPSTTDSPLHYPSEAPSTTDSPLPFPSESPSTTDSPLPYPSEAPSTTDSPLPYPSEAPSITDSPLPYPSESPSITDSPLPYPSESPSITDSPLPFPSESPSITDSPLPYPSESPSTTDSPLPYPSEAPSITDSPLPYPSESPSITDSPLPYPSEAPSTTDSPLPYPSEAPTEAPATQTPATQGPSITTSPLPYPTESPSVTEIPTKPSTEVPSTTEVPFNTVTPLPYPTGALITEAPSVTATPELTPLPTHSLSEELTPTPTPIPLDIIESCYEFLIYPANSTYLIVADNACNDKTIPTFDLNEFDDLEFVQIGNNNFQHTDTFIVEDLDKLEILQIGMNSFAKEKNSTMSDTTRTFHIQNCTHLKVIEIDVYSFNDYAGSFVLTELPELESLSIGVIGSDSYNFYSASFVAKSMKFVLLSIVVLPSLQNILLGDGAFHDSLNTVFDGTLVRD